MHHGRAYFHPNLNLFYYLNQNSIHFSKKLLEICGRRRYNVCMTYAFNDENYCVSWILCHCGFTTMFEQSCNLWQEYNSCDTLRNACVLLRLPGPKSAWMVHIKRLDKKRVSIQHLPATEVMAAVHQHVHTVNSYDSNEEYSTKASLWINNLILYKDGPFC